MPREIRTSILPWEELFRPLLPKLGRSNTVPARRNTPRLGTHAASWKGPSWTFAKGFNREPCFRSHLGPKTLTLWQRRACVGSICVSLCPRIAVSQRMALGGRRTETSEFYQWSLTPKRDIAITRWRQIRALKPAPLSQFIKCRLSDHREL